MSIAAIRNPVVRRLALVVFGPVLFLGIILMGAGEGATRAGDEAWSALVAAWRGRKK